MKTLCSTNLYVRFWYKRKTSLPTNNFNNHAGRPYYGYGQPPPPGYPGGPGMMPGPGVVYYPVHPAYVYPYPHPPNSGIEIVDHPTDIVPELPGETVELPYSKSGW